MEFKAKTKGGYDYEILKETKEYLVGVVYDNECLEGLFATIWHLDGTHLRHSGYNLIPKKRRIWVLKNDLNIEGWHKLHCSPPMEVESYIEFEEVE